jgi:hypothetical protein
MRVNRAAATVLTAFALASALGTGTAAADGQDHHRDIPVISGTLATGHLGTYGTFNEADPMNFTHSGGHHQRHHGGHHH